MVPTNVLPAITPLLRRPAVEAATGKSRSTIYREIARNLFPKPVQIGGERVAWPANEVAAINAARIAGKPEDQIKALVLQLEAARAEQNAKQ
jgi:prophage regulatory protein